MFETHKCNDCDRRGCKPVVRDHRGRLIKFKPCPGWKEIRRVVPLVEKAMLYPSSLNTLGGLRLGIDVNLSLYL